MGDKALAPKSRWAGDQVLGAFVSTQITRIGSDRAEGGLGLIGLYTVLLVLAFAIALRSGSQFGRLLALGLATTFFLYFFINIAMVMGLIPVVGVPLPLVSYGGTAMLSLMFAFGLIICVHVHRDLRISRRWLHQAE